MLASDSKVGAYRLRPSVTLDSYGEPVESWDDPQRHPLRGAKDQPVSTVEEENSTRRTVDDERLLLIPRRVDLTEADRVELLDGSVWRVDGTPATRRGLASGVLTTVALKRYVRGGAPSPRASDSTAEASPSSS